MTKDVVTVDTDTPYKQIAEILAAHKISGVPVVDSDAHVLGVVSEADLLAKAECPTRSGAEVCWIAPVPHSTPAGERRCRSGLMRLLVVYSSEFSGIRRVALADLLNRPNGSTARGFWKLEDRTWSGKVEMELGHVLTTGKDPGYPTPRGAGRAGRASLSSQSAPSTRHPGIGGGCRAGRTRQCRCLPDPRRLRRRERPRTRGGGCCRHPRVRNRTGAERSAAPPTQPLGFDPETGQVTVVSVWGDSDWVRNIRKKPAARVQIRRRCYVPEQQFLSTDDIIATERRFRREHPWIARGQAQLMHWPWPATDEQLRVICEQMRAVTFTPAAQPLVPDAAEVLPMAATGQPSSPSPR